MESAIAHPLPARDPVSGGPLVITELEGTETGITIRGRFEMPRFAQLNADQARFLETFLRCRGMLNSVEKELGISYPTARARLDAVLKALELTPRGEEPSASSMETSIITDAPHESAGAPPGEVGSSEPTPEPVPEPKPEATFAEAIFDAMTPDEEPSAPPKRTPKEILDAIERGEITAQEAKAEIKANP